MRKKLAFNVFSCSVCALIWSGLPAAAQFAVTDHTPANGAVSAAAASDITVHFNTDVDTNTVSNTTFTVRGAQFGLYDGTFTFPASTTVVFDLDTDFMPGEHLQVTLTENIKWTGGTALTPHSFTFYVETGGQTNFYFSLAQEIDTNVTFDLELADVDRDGDLDILLAREAGLQVLTNDGSGFFYETPIRTPAHDASLGGINIGDLDGDGDIDAVVTPQNVNKNAFIWTNDGSGVFGVYQTIPFTNAYDGKLMECRDAGLGDIDGDGDLDAYFGLGSGQSGFGFSKVYANNGSALFSLRQSDLSFFQETVSVELADLDGDGDLDSFIATQTSDALLLNNGTGFFTDSGQTLGNSVSTKAILGDVDGDGDIDAVTTLYGQGNRLYINNGTGAMTDSAQSLGSYNSWVGAMGDVDGDGDMDLVEGNFSQANRVYLNNGAGSFSLANLSMNTRQTRGIVLGDVDGDGDLDVVEGTVGYQPTVIWKNKKSPDLQLAKTAEPSSFGANTALSFLLTVTNAGEDVMSSITVTDALPVGLTFEAAGSSPECTNTGGGVVVCSVASMLPGASRTFTVAVSVINAPVGALTNIAACATTNWEPNVVNNEDDAVALVLDSDSDTLPDYWEAENGLNPTNSADGTANSDDDEFTNDEEFVAGTHPTNGLSFFQAEDIDVSTNDGLQRIRWVNNPGRTYHINASTNLITSGFYRKVSDLTSRTAAYIVYTNAASERMEALELIVSP